MPQQPVQQEFVAATVYAWLFRVLSGKGFWGPLILSFSILSCLMSPIGSHTVLDFRAYVLSGCGDRVLDLVICGIYYYGTSCMSSSPRSW
jgi:hypothetical protein